MIYFAPEHFYTLIAGRFVRLPTPCSGIYLQQTQNMTVNMNTCGKLNSFQMTIRCSVKAKSIPVCVVCSATLVMLKIRDSAGSNSEPAMDNKDGF